MINTILSALRKKTTDGQPSGETVIYDREMLVYNALRLLIPREQPGILGGKYSWLISPSTGHPLQLDLFFPRITTISEVELATPRCLAVEVQSSLHDGVWNDSKKRFFRSQDDFERYVQNQEWKRSQLLARKIPFMEIDPTTEDLSPAILRRRLGSLFGLIL